MLKKVKQYNKSEREEIAKLSLDPETKISALAKRFGVSANSIYGWRRRYLKTEGLSGKEKQALIDSLREQ